MSTKTKHVNIIYFNINVYFANGLGGIAKKANIFGFFSLFFLRKNENFEWKIACNFFDFFFIFLIVLIAIGYLVLIFFFLESLESGYLFNVVLFEKIEDYTVDHGHRGH